MSQGHFGIDGMTTRHTENLQVRVLAVAFIRLQIETKAASPLLFLNSFQVNKDRPRTVARAPGKYHERAVATETSCVEPETPTDLTNW